MKNLKYFKEEIHKCSKCGICQADCPIYKITLNDCAVSRGLFVMLNGVVKDKLKISQTINRYLNLCLKCGKCAKSCPSGIDVIDIIIAAKSEYFNKHLLEKFKSFIIKNVIFGLSLNIANLFTQKSESKNFAHKVLFFDGCGGKLKGNTSVIKLMNNIGIEVITPQFKCCGIPFLTRGDLKTFQNFIDAYIKVLKQHQVSEILTTCASCEKTIKEYYKWVDKEEDKEFLKNIKVKNIYQYLSESNIKLKLKKTHSVTYHHPCNMDNYNNIKQILQNIKNLNYIEMKSIENCCGLNGLGNFKDFKILKNIFCLKRKSIIDTKAKTTLTSCLGCEIALKSYSFGQYKTYDLIDFISKNIE